MTFAKKFWIKEIPVEIKGRRAGDPAVLYADISKVKNVLGWMPEKSLEDSIKGAYLWEKRKFKV